MLRRRRSLRAGARPPPRRARRAFRRAPSRSCWPRACSSEPRDRRRSPAARRPPPPMSAGRPPRSPSTPTARITMSAPPSSRNAGPSTCLVAAQLAARRARTASTRAASRGAELLSAGPQRRGGRGRAVRPRAGCEPAARGRSRARSPSVPPSTSTRRPHRRRSRSSRCPAQPEPAGQIGAQHALRVDPRALRVEAIELGIHRAQRVATAGAHPWSGRPARRHSRRARRASRARRARPGAAARDVERERPALQRKRQRVPERCARSA